MPDRYGADNIQYVAFAGFTDSLNLPDGAKLSSLNRLARAEEQAKVAAFLLSDDSSYITGQALGRTGRYTAYVAYLLRRVIEINFYIFVVTWPSRLERLKLQKYSQ